MMRKIGMLLSVLALCGGTAFSQSEMDAFKYAQSDLNGTARYLSMGGAFGALGGDISSMNSNPAGLAVYRSSEVVTTLSLSSVGTNTNWLGSKVDGNKTKVNFDNIAYVGYFPTSNDVGIVSWNVGFSYNRVKNYSRNYTMHAGQGLHTSLSDYIASRAYGYPVDLLGSDKPYDNPELGDWLSILGYQAGYIDATANDDSEYYSAFGDNVNGRWEPYQLSGASMNVSERGAIDLYNMSFGLNISDFVMLGASVAITDLNYRMESSYDESFVNSNSLYLANALRTDGTGYSFNLGAIVRPTDFLRLGVAYNSPTWYKMSDYYLGDASSYLTYTENGQLKERSLKANTPNNPQPYYDYQYRTPDKWIFSAAAIFGTTALLSVDYELANFQSMRLYDTNGNSNVSSNSDITADFKSTSTLRVGAEVKVTPQFSLRAGFAWSESPMKDHLKNADVEVFTVGTIPNYTIDKGALNYTFGLGYRFTPNFYTDLACVFRTHKEDVYAFSSMFDDKGEFLTAQPATMKTNTTKVALTLGYKF